MTGFPLLLYYQRCAYTIPHIYQGHHHMCRDINNSLFCWWYSYLQSSSIISRCLRSQKGPRKYHHLVRLKQHEAPWRQVWIYMQPHKLIGPTCCSSSHLHQHTSKTSHQVASLCIQLPISVTLECISQMIYPGNSTLLRFVTKPDRWLHVYSVLFPLDALIYSWCCTNRWSAAIFNTVAPLESIQNIRHPKPREYIHYTANICTSKIAGLEDLHYYIYLERLEKFSLLSLQRRRERQLAIHMWKIRYGLTSNDLQITFVDNNRHGTIAKVTPLQKCCKMRQKPRIWNCIPGHIRKWDTLDLVKRNLTKFMLQVPDKPPIRGYTSPNSNSILDWRNEKEMSTSTFSGGWGL